MTRLFVCVALALCGCPWSILPEQTDCTPGSQRCHGNMPQLCSSTRRWYDVGDSSCATCAVTEGIAHCAGAAR